MQYLILSGSNHGNKTKMATEALHDLLESELTEQDQVELLNLQDLHMTFSDGRHHMDWENEDNDNYSVIQAVLKADVIFIGTPIFQASIPGSLKNVFDLLPENGLEHKVVGVVATAGSPRHYLAMEHQLMPILNYMKAVAVPKYVYIESREFAEEGVASDDIHFRLKNLILDTQQLSQAYQAIWQAEEEAYGF